MIKALLFDVFGTVVDWRSGISQDFELISKKYGINKNSKQFADDWRAEYQPSMEKVRSGSREFVKLDILHDDFPLFQLQSFHVLYLYECNSLNEDFQCI